MKLRARDLVVGDRVIYKARRFGELYSDFVGVVVEVGRDGMSKVEWSGGRGSDPFTDQVWWEDRGDLELASGLDIVLGLLE